ncbi:MAG: pyridoxal phosphate-dependent decarboxylase family protein [Terriglobales bacterium]
MTPVHPFFASDLALDADLRLQLWQKLSTEIERYLRQVANAPVAPKLDAPALRRALGEFDFATGMPPAEAMQFAVAGLWEHQVHTAHPRYFGLFNPAPTTMGVVADALVAAFNPQLAAWSHNPFAAEVEQHLIAAVAAKFGYPEDAADGVFTSGGAEANHTALLCALTHAFPEYGRRGAAALLRPPAIYVGTQSHHSMIKAARLCGLGTEAVRVLEVDDSLRLRAEDVAKALACDRTAGLEPLLVVATLGTTGTGVLDRVAELAELAEREHLWLHADAAWGGMAAIVPELRPAIEGIERADSITFDAHKSLSVPMGAGMLLTRHRDILERTFRVNEDYMPRDAAGLREAGVDPFAHSMQWSRRFIGLKLFLSLAVAGWDGYAAVLRHQTSMGHLLREEATAAGWRIVNETPLPLVCLAAPGPDGDTPRVVEPIARAAVASGQVWVSVAALPRGRAAIRCCITNYRTGPQDVAALVQSLNQARGQARR